MNVIFLGAPGAGKGTQAALICEEFKVPHVSTGDILRRNIKEGTPLGVKAKEYIDKGALVPDEGDIGVMSLTVFHARFRRRRHWIRLRT